MKPREKQLAAMTGAAALAFLVLVLVVDPVRQSLQLDEKIRMEAYKLQKYRKLIRTRGARAHREAGEKNAEQSGTGPLFELEKLASDAGVRIVELRPETRQDKKDAITISLRTEAKEENYIRMLHSLPASSFRLKRLQLTARPGSDVLEGSLLLVSLE